MAQNDVLFELIIAWNQKENCQLGKLELGCMACEWRQRKFQIMSAHSTQSTYPRMCDYILVIYYM